MARRETDPELVARLSLAVARLARILRQHHDAEWMTPAVSAAFTTIVRRGPISLTDLAAAERVSRSTMTKLVRRLEDDGLIERVIDEDDHRVHRVRLSTAGRRSIARHRANRNVWFAEQLDGLDQTELAHVLGALTFFERLTEGPDPVEAD
jgi:DNA-binding MarR family transcriptional regulator